MQRMKSVTKRENDLVYDIVFEDGRKIALYESGYQHILKLEEIDNLLSSLGINDKMRDEVFSLISEVEEFGYNRGWSDGYHDS